MEEAPENGKESPHSAHANGMNEWMNTQYYAAECKKNRSSNKIQFDHSHCKNTVRILLKSYKLLRSLESCSLTLFSSSLWLRVASWLGTNASEEYVASVIRVEVRHPSHRRSTFLHYIGTHPLNFTVQKSEVHNIKPQPGKNLKSYEWLLPHYTSNHFQMTTVY